MLENNFIVIVPVYNAEKYIRRCLDSILTQNYKNYDLVVIDDCSTDDTYEIIKDVHNSYGGFNMVRHKKRAGVSLVARIEGLEFITKKDKDYIIVNIDGDDYLPNDTVFSFLNEVYQDENICMTYGQYEPESHLYSNLCRQLDDTRTYRKSGQWFTSHLRTYKKKVFDLIRDEDLRDRNGKYYMIGDAAVMFPLIELCGLKRIKFISKVIYMYNDLNTISQMRLNPRKQLAQAVEIRKKPEYEELPENWI